MTLNRLGFALALGLMMGFAAQSAPAQRRRFAPPPPPPPPKVETPPSASAKPAPPVKAGNAQPTLRGMEGLPPKWVEKLRDMSPEEQQRFLRNNKRFRNLPPQRQAQILRNLQDWNRRSPTEQNAVRDRERILEGMSPEQRQYLRNVIEPKWQQMSPDRRQLINGRLHTLQAMSPSDRAAALNDPNFMQGLSPDEQSVLRGLDSLRNPPQNP